MLLFIMYIVLSDAVTCVLCVLLCYVLGPPQENMANPKEKTPMCLVNELARFNKIQPEYKLLCEQGPAHSKVHFLQTIQSCRFICGVFSTNNGLYVLRFPPLSDFLSSTHTGRSALGSRGDQHQESPAFRCCICPR